MPKDYKSFSGVAKVRFRETAKELGYNQISGTLYAQKCAEWFNVFGLQKSSCNDFFYVNYGISIPNWWALDSELVEDDIRGLLISTRLSNAGRGGFDCGTKLDVEKSSQRVLEEYKKQALPWLEPIQSIEAIAEKYYHSQNISWDELGQHGYYSQIGAAGYGFLLYRAGRISDSLKWLKEAKRLMEMPVYYLRNGGIAHEKQKYAQLAKKEDYEIEQFESISMAINEIENA